MMGDVLYEISAMSARLSGPEPPGQASSPRGRNRKTRPVEDAAHTLRTFAGDTSVRQRVASTWIFPWDNSVSDCAHVSEDETRVR
jgi:hypothetical protein